MSFISNVAPLIVHSNVMSLFPLYVRVAITWEYMLLPVIAYLHAQINYLMQDSHCALHSTYDVRYRAGNFVFGISIVYLFL